MTVVLMPSLSLKTFVNNIFREWNKIRKEDYAIFELLGNGSIFVPFNQLLWVLKWVQNVLP
jgi:hypothetical protein